ncbi:hypothetical protein F4781DRAFT_437789 [Annulohypoxylon bovei var. microspora]|nr:hypothetical protein F4781DRAFT_437789 [Annulohypoxylon bovei var. microspora]
MTHANALLTAMTDDLDGIDKSLCEEDIRADALWGFAVYRVSYGNDAAWNRMLERIEGRIRKRLELQSHDDLLSPHHSFAVDNLATYDRRKLDAIRVAFRTWARDELKRNSAEQPNSGTSGGIIEGFNDIGHENTTYVWERDRDYFAGARHNFFLVVDELCLESLGDMSTGPVVKLVRAEFSPLSQDDKGMSVYLDEEEKELDYPVGF